MNISIFERMNDLVILFFNDGVDVKAKFRFKVQIATSTSFQVDGLMNRSFEFISEYHIHVFDFTYYLRLVPIAEKNLSHVLFAMDLSIEDLLSNLETAQQKKASVRFHR